MRSSVSGSGRRVGRGRLGICGRPGWRGLEHPVLGAAVGLADGDGVVLTGRLSLGSHPWLAGSCGAWGGGVAGDWRLLELAVRAGDEVGCGRVEELTLAAPLVVPPVRWGAGAGAGGWRRCVGSSSGRCVFAVGGCAGAVVDAARRGCVGGGRVCRWWRCVGGVAAGGCGGGGSCRALCGVGAGVGWVRAGVSGVAGGVAFGWCGVRRGGVWLIRWQAGAFGVHPALLDAALHGCGWWIWVLVVGCRLCGRGCRWMRWGLRRCGCG